MTYTESIDSVTVDSCFRRQSSHSSV